MTHIWISPQLAHTLGWALLHFLWQGVALAAICSTFMAMCRTASARYVIALATLVLMLAAPLITFFVLQRSAAAAASTTNFAATPSNAVANLPLLSASAPVSPAAPNYARAASVRHAFVARRSLVRRRLFLQPAHCRRPHRHRAHAPQSRAARQRPFARKMSRAPAPHGPCARDSLLRMPLLGSSRGDRLVPSRRFAASHRAQRPFRRSARRGHFSRARAHPPPRLFSSTSSKSPPKLCSSTTPPSGG